MIINYEMAHKLVENSKNMFWDGWNIVEYKKDPESIYTKNARFIDGNWCSVNIYKPENYGWKVPDKYARI